MPRVGERRRITVRDVHASPRLLAHFLQLPPFGQQATVEVLQATIPPTYQKVPVDPPRPETEEEFADRVAKAEREYRRACFRTDERQQSYKQFLRECLKVEFAMTKGSVVECCKRLIGKHVYPWGITTYKESRGTMKQLEEECREQMLLDVLNDFLDIKAKYPDKIVLYDDGNFYHAIGGDALLIADRTGWSVKTDLADGMKHLEFGTFCSESSIKQIVSCCMPVVIFDGEEVRDA